MIPPLSLIIYSLTLPRLEYTLKIMSYKIESPHPSAPAMKPIWCSYISTSQSPRTPVNVNLLG